MSNKGLWYGISQNTTIAGNSQTAAKARFMKLHESITPKPDFSSQYIVKTYSLLNINTMPPAI